MESNLAVSAVAAGMVLLQINCIRVNQKGKKGSQMFIRFGQ